MEFRTEPLNACTLENTAWRRDLPPNFDITDVDISRHDTTTLFYDAIWTGKQVELICPLLFNLEPLIADGKFALDGQPAPVKALQKREYQHVVEIEAASRPETISLTIDDQVLAGPVSDGTQADFFHGLNVVVNVQKDNDPIWIRDFLTYHRKVHGLEGYLVFDNASTRYDIDALGEAGEAAGLKRMMVVKTPFSYGMRSKLPEGQPDRRAMSLQVSMLNIARLRFLRQARAVLQIDIDEVVWCRKGSIFDAVQRHPIGFMMLPSQWRYARPAPHQKPRARDHVLKRTVPDPWGAKWVMRSSSPLYQFHWRNHGLWRLRGQRFFNTSKAGLWHCRALTTGWKYKTRQTDLPDDLVIDHAGSEALARFDFD